MEWYFYIAWIAIISQILFTYQILRNYFDNLKKFNKPRSKQGPETVLIIPCKGIDPAFEKNVTSFFTQNYRPFELWFVVEDESDPAYSALRQLRLKLSDSCQAQKVRILVAGKSSHCSQKIHNLLYCCRQVHQDVRILAFADSDACLRDIWLSQMVYYAGKDKIGAATGYRWFVPKTNNLATIALSALNAKIVQLLGNTRFNQLWGGSMAIKTETFKKLKIADVWQNALSDDLSLSSALKKKHLKVAFVPACIVASYESIRWPGLFEFARRQYLITRICVPGTWLFALSSCLYSILGIWAAAAMAFYAKSISADNLVLYSAVPIVFLVLQALRALLRQKLIRKILSDEKHNLKPTAIADISLFWLWSILMLVMIVTSAFGNTITWRGIRYKLISPTDTTIIEPKK